MLFIKTELYRAHKYAYCNRYYADGQGYRYAIVIILCWYSPTWPQTRCISNTCRNLLDCIGTLICPRVPTDTHATVDNLMRIRWTYLRVPSAILCRNNNSNTYRTAMCVVRGAVRGRKLSRNRSSSRGGSSPKVTLRPVDTVVTGGTGIDTRVGYSTRLTRYRTVVPYSRQRPCSIVKTSRNNNNNCKL